MIDIRPIKGPESFFYGGGWFVLGFFLLALSLVGVWLWLRWRSKPLPSPDQPASQPEETARRRLEETLAFLNNPSDFTVRISAILREYLEASLALPAPERTTDEFLIEIQSHPQLRSAQRAQLALFLQRCDLVKFAREELGVSELRALYQAALQLINETQTAALPAPSPASPQIARS